MESERTDLDGTTGIDARWSPPVLQMQECAVNQNHFSTRREDESRVPLLSLKGTSSVTEDPLPPPRRALTPDSSGTPGAFSTGTWGDSPFGPQKHCSIGLVGE